MNFYKICSVLVFLAHIEQEEKSLCFLFHRLIYPFFINIDFCCLPSAVRVENIYSFIVFFASTTSSSLKPNPLIYLFYREYAHFDEIFSGFYGFFPYASKNCVKSSCICSDIFVSSMNITSSKSPSESLGNYG